ncbi:TPA: hypothetical protein PXI89_002942 [Yersinia enterocolitica]|nr:hypothetical protein [Yersinia enterocolitica]
MSEIKLYDTEVSIAKLEARIAKLEAAEPHQDNIRLSQSDFLGILFILVVISGLLTWPVKILFWS